MRMEFAVATWIISGTLACKNEESSSDAGHRDASVVEDGSVTDSGETSDAGASQDANASVDAGVEDTGAPDARGDAGSPVVGPVTISLAFRGASAADVPVVFRSASDELVAVVRTDGTGSATHELEAGGSVTAVYVSSGLASVYSFLGVEPGDHLSVGRPDPVFRTATVTVPSVEALDARYWVRGACLGGYATSSSVPVRAIDPCVRGDLFIAAVQNQNPYRDYGSFIARDVDLSVGSIDVTGVDFQPATPVSLGLLHVPATGRFANASVRVRKDSVGLWLAAASGVSHVDFDDLGAPQTTAMIPAVEPDALGVDLTIAHTGPTDRVAVRRVVERKGAASSYQLDLDSVQVPVLTEVPRIDGSGVVTWAETSGDAEWLWGAFRSQNGGTIDRSILAAHPSGTGTKTVQFPTLPPELSMYAPSAGDVAETSFFMVGRSPGGYARFRRAYESDAFDLLTVDGDRFESSSILP